MKQKGSVMCDRTTFDFEKKIELTPINKINNDALLGRSDLPLVRLWDETNNIK